MFKLKYLDGSPVEQSYVDAVSSLVAGAAAATEIVSEDELEEYAAHRKQAEHDAASEAGSLDLAALAAVADMANSYVEDILSGLKDGTYEKEENRDLDHKIEALSRVRNYLAASL